MATSRRPGQVRFEAWVPEHLMVQFKHKVPNRAAWLREAMQEATRPPDCAHTRREQAGSRMSMGTELPIWRCSDCGAALN
jgi:ribosomal protein L37AE/L43A